MEMLFLLEKLYRDPLALSRFSQFRCFQMSKGEIIQDLNENHEFQVCFVLKGSLCLFKDQIESMPLIAIQNEFFFISSLHKCKIKAMNDVQIVVHACNIVAPYLHNRIIEYLKERISGWTGSTSMGFISFTVTSFRYSIILLCR